MENGLRCHGGRDDNVQHSQPNVTALPIDNAAHHTQMHLYALGDGVR